MSDVSLNECIQTAIEAEKKGVEVDWRAMCFKVYNLASNRIANMEKENEDADSTLQS